MLTQLEVLLVEDSEGDVELTLMAFQEAVLNNKLHVARDGEEALNFLYQRAGFESAPRPDIILLDLNLPKVSGKEVLQEIKQDPALLSIPVVILTSSQAEMDIVKSYGLHANAYIVKPVEWDPFYETMTTLGEFWGKTVSLVPRKKKHG